MANWSNYRKLVVLIPFVLIYLLGSGTKKSQAVQWGFFGHKRINRIAVFTLPPEIFGFYKEHIEFLTDHAVDPDKRRYAVEGEAQCHYIDLDHYYKPGENPYEIMPQNELPTTATALIALSIWMEQNSLNRLITKTQIIIAPGYRFKIIDGLITNFHQPQSTLLLLVAAITNGQWKPMYDYALQNEFRFLSYGDGCLIWLDPSVR
jgi:hypothetical protein